MRDNLPNMLRAAAKEWRTGNKVVATGATRYDAALDEAADAIEELSKPRWIPVTERLPEEYTSILFFSSSGQVHVGYYDSEYKSLCDMTGFRYVCTHWMPLPQPPEEEKDKND